MFYKLNIGLIVLLVCFTACNKLVQIPEPLNTITTPETFQTEANATSAVLGIYGRMSVAPYIGGQITQLTGLSSDELINFNNDVYLTGFRNNTLSANFFSATINGNFWQPIYATIYQANAAIEGLQASSSISAPVKNELIGEAKFMRAFCHFYLTNLFGDIPLITSIAWANTSLLTKSSSGQIYEQIIADLTDAISKLPEDYTFSAGDRTRPNKWAATALLARVYLYNGKWADADIQAGKVIANSGLYSLVNLNDVFLINSGEAIWQIQLLNVSPWATQDGFRFIPVRSTVSPRFYLTGQLLNSFEPGDARRDAWVGKATVSGNDYYYPYKYKVRQGEADNITEYYMALRFSEQYLIRAEAKAHEDDLSGAIEDLNVIRRRATLPDLPGSLSQSEVISAVAQERRIELFSELGHRWLDLKRTGKADSVLSLIKPQWQPYQKLYPIPVLELQNDPNLTQNAGY